ncbi:hypothetical protein GGU10DRAFT_386617 [Lentinula aff. detonsa]|uniref:F-box domain-containing protein n=1 Tax=Lentinula aff. detonsa TaxID=2804958 RepID=A0AA38KGV9_9AGAR|nr:hypothetical protein GGU10DRAFT_386617 [Lentinula aff. detonsa]
MLLLSLPNEVILELFKYLNTSDIISLRQTCTHLAEITNDKLLWSNLVQQLRTRLPLPPSVRTSFEDWSADALESLVVSVELIDDLWLVARESPPVKLQNKRGEILLGLKIFLDRWILAVYTDGYINLWDTESANEDDYRRWCFVYTGNDKTTSFQAVLDDTGEKLLVVITRAHLPGTWVVALYEVLLSDPPLKLQFTLVCTFPTSSSRMAQEIHPPKRIIAFSQLGSIELAHWSDNSKENITSVSISNPQADELEEMFTTILSLRILSDGYVFVFKTRSIELYPLPKFTAAKRSGPSSPSFPMPSLRHIFPSYNFRDVQISDVETGALTEEEVSSSEGDGTRYRLKMLASDIIQGLFYFVVNIIIPSTQDQIPILDVHLAAIYAMANNIPFHSKNRLQRHQQSTLEETSESRSFMPLMNPNTAGPIRPVIERFSMPRSDRVNSARSSSFVSTYAVGSQGMRAVWIERRRGTTLKQIVSCRLNAPSTMDDNNPGVVSESGLEPSDSDSPSLENTPGFDFLPQALDGQVVYSIQSYDLREDITYCALGEVSGKIILGNRSGDVFVLETGA